jgi:hypothetical protein
MRRLLRSYATSPRRGRRWIPPEKNGLLVNPWDQAISLFFWQQNTGRRMVRFRNHPKTFHRARISGTLISSVRKLFATGGPAFLTTVFAVLFRRSYFRRARCHVPCPAAQSRRGLTPLLPTIEFAQRPRPPQPRAATSKRLYRTRAELRASVHSSPRTRIR